VDISVVVCTHNRSALLHGALTHLLTQDFGGLAVEIIVVDNNSTDDTAEVVRGLARAASAEVTYTFEEAQGLSYARNAGWALARAPIVAFTDDDIYVQRDWAARIAATFAQHSHVDCVGGKVLPKWPQPPPAWLTRDHWAPLAILDYGDKPLQLDRTDSRCLVGANLAFRRSVFDRLGGFSPDFQRVKDTIGSLEDHEFLTRFWKAGGRALYAPDIVATAPVDLSRLEKAYHRRWHYGHGHFYAVMRAPSIEASRMGRLFDVPAHLYRQFFEDGAAWCGCAVRGRWNDAFAYETRLRFFLGFFHTRRRQYLTRILRRRRLPAEASAIRGEPHSTGAS